MDEVIPACLYVAIPTTSTRYREAGRLPQGKMLITTVVKVRNCSEKT